MPEPGRPPNVEPNYTLTTAQSSRLWASTCLSESFEARVPHYLSLPQLPALDMSKIAYRFHGEAPHGVGDH